MKLKALSIYMKTFTFMVLLSALTANPASAQDKRELLGSFRDWDAFTIERATGEKICYMVSQPKASTPQGVNRGDIYTMITMRPRVRIENEVNVVVGYPFRASSEATATVDAKQFRMFTEGDGAWLRTPREDGEMVAAMRAGSTLIVRGTSSRGTNTQDRYSLMGFTSAHNAIKQACPSD